MSSDTRVLWLSLILLIAGVVGAGSVLIGSITGVSTELLLFDCVLICTGRSASSDVLACWGLDVLLVAGVGIIVVSVIAEVRSLTVSSNGVSTTIVVTAGSSIGLIINADFVGVLDTDKVDEETDAKLFAFGDEAVDPVCFKVAVSLEEV